MRVQTFSRAQILQDFESRCQSLAANDLRGFRQDFEDLNEVGRDLPTRAGDLEANRWKNRYPSIVPYDHCRVRLSAQNFDPYSDYINASFVPGGGTERDFICTQGPMHNTMADFWRMVWEQNVRIIVMLTPLRHKDAVLCEKYWPLERRTLNQGLVQVTTLSCKQGPDYLVTTINLRQRDSPTDRTITHYSYTSWPDQGVPKDPLSLCAFAEHVRQHLKANPALGPAVVHCSAGVGRSGTFVALVWLMQLCVRGIRPDVRAAVEDLRLHRMWMVQTLNQYFLVHRCLLHWLGGDKGGILSRITLIDRESSKITSHNKDRQKHRGRRRRHRHPSEKPLPEPPQSTIQKILHPGNLLRRILPSSSLFNPG